MMQPQQLVTLKSLLLQTRFLLKGIRYRFLKIINYYGWILKLTSFLNFKNLIILLLITGKDLFLGDKQQNLQHLFYICTGHLFQN